MPGEKIGIWLAQIRANFLLLPVLLVSLGGAMAFKHGSFSWITFYLTMIGIISAHISVNLFNEYSDYRTGIDLYTEKTPFSGGSGMLQAGLTDPQTVKFFAWLSLFSALLIGLYLTVKTGPVLLLIIALGAFATVCYTDYLARWIMGKLFAVTSNLIPTTCILACLSIPLGFLAFYNGWLHSTKGASILPALKWNVAVVLGTDFLLLVGVLMS